MVYVVHHDVVGVKDFTQTKQKACVFSGTLYAVGNNNKQQTSILKSVLFGQRHKFGVMFTLEFLTTQVTFSVNASEESELVVTHYY